MKKIKLLCIPCAAASAMMFMKWKEYLSDNIEVVPVELPGRGLRYKDKLIKDMNSLVNDLFNLIKHKISGDEDYAILGYCMGSVIAYELYRKICIEGFKKPIHIFISASRTPDIQEKLPSIFEVPQDEVIFGAARMLAFRIGSKTGRDEYFFNNFMCMMDPNNKKDLLNMSDNQIIEELNLFNDKKDINEDDLKSIHSFKKLAELLQIDSLLLHSYHTEMPIMKFTSDVTLIMGSFDTVIKSEEEEAWRKYCENGFEIIRVKGGHLVMFDNLEDITSIVNKNLQFKGGLLSV